MRFMWIDTETTGLDTSNSSAFQVAFILVDSGKVKEERTFLFNPLSDTILYHEGAGKVHGYTEEQIRELYPEKEVVPNIAKLLEFHKKDGKLVFSGYNCNFDYSHLKAVLERNGYNIDDYFEGFKADVYEQVKKASSMKILPWLGNQRLETVCNHFGITFNAHDALEDIRATRTLSHKLHSQGATLL